MKLIQEDVYNLLQNVLSADDIYSFQPPVLFEDGSTQLIVFSETENNPIFYADGLEDFSTIFYNIDTYSKNPDLDELAVLINEEMIKYGFTRISAGQTFYDSQNSYYVRLLTFTIQI